MGEVLCVVSKTKKYIKDKGGMNTSASATLALTEIIEKCCDQAIENANKDGRKTVLDRDFSSFLENSN